MFFILSKLLYFIITPVFWILILLILAFVIKRAKVQKKLLLTGIIVFIFFTNNFIVNIFLINWEVPVISAKTITEKYENGVVLGGMLTVNSKNNKIQFSPSIDRLLQAITLYKQGIIKRIVISGGSGSVFNQDDKEAIFIKNICTQLGIPQNDIIIETDSKNTHENALLTRKIIGTQNEIILFTSAFHMRRASACFRHEGFKIKCFSTDPLELPFLGPDDYFIPKADPLIKWSLIIKEWVGYISYKIAGYI